MTSHSPSTLLEPSTFVALVNDFMIEGMDPSLETKMVTNLLLKPSTLFMHSCTTPDEKLQYGVAQGASTPDEKLSCYVPSLYHYDEMNLCGH